MYRKAFGYDKGDFCKNNSLLFERVSDVRFSRRFQPPHQEIIRDKSVRRLELGKQEQIVWSKRDVGKELEVMPHRV